MVEYIFLLKDRSNNLCFVFFDIEVAIQKGFELNLSIERIHVFADSQAKSMIIKNIS